MPPDTNLPDSAQTSHYVADTMGIPQQKPQFPIHLHQIILSLNYLFLNLTLNNMSLFSPVLFYVFPESFCTCFFKKFFSNCYICLSNFFHGILSVACSFSKPSTCINNGKSSILTLPAFANAFTARAVLVAITTASNV